MSDESLLLIREFSLLTGIKRENLRFYDKVGLLSPEVRGDNGYRYYNRHQIDSAFLISDLRALGVSLPEIKRYAGERSPESMLKLFKEQNKNIEKEITRLRSIQELMKLRTEMAASALKHNVDDLFFEEKADEPIFVCQPLEPTISNDDALINAYDYAASKGVDVSFPLGTIVNKKSLIGDGPEKPSHHYFKVSKGKNSFKPGGTYAVIYKKSSYSSLVLLYHELLDFISDNGYHVDSDSYEEYPLDEMTTPLGELHGIRIEIKVIKE